MTTENSNRRPKYERQISAGGVVYRRGEGKLEILLCGRHQPILWALPKGTPNPGEAIQETARREVSEETGVQVEIERELGAIRYFFMRTQDNTRCDKTVHHYLMRPCGGNISLHDHEFDEVRWFPIRDAMASMSYPNEVNIVRKAYEALIGQPLPDDEPPAPEFSSGNEEQP